MRTGRSQRYCPPCRKIVSAKSSRASEIRSGKIRNPGVGTGGNQLRGCLSPFFKPNAPHRFRDFIGDRCERCGSRKFLCVHHLDYDHANNKVTNLETVCKSCHQKEHKVYRNFPPMTEERRAKQSEWAKELNKKSRRDMFGRLMPGAHKCKNL